MEDHLGHTTNVFGILRMKVPFKYDMMNPLLNALCYPTDVHAFKNPLRKEEFKLHRAFVACRLEKHTEKKWKVSKNVDDNNSKTQDEDESLNITNSPFTQSPPSEPGMHLAKRGLELNPTPLGLVLWAFNSSILSLLYYLQLALWGTSVLGQVDLVAMQLVLR